MWQSHLWDLVLYRRGVKITGGNALAARLAKTAFDLGIPLLTGTPAQYLISESGAITGAVVSDEKGEYQISARRAVVIASGGFPHDRARTARAYPAPRARRRTSVADTLGQY
jgi:glycerol-3-phosphate dehydrogenase